ncbi:MAG: hypothetical protein LLG20_16725 [Acidobacteriales bacterium]|nr:hypothetical protein [Terriglobales bacterium]
MANDIFGDLQSWVRVLDQMERLASEGALDQHQRGLARVLRYPFNWRLRQAALRNAGLLKEPSEEVIEVVLRILRNEHGDIENRILAGNALASMMSNGAAASMSDEVRCRIVQGVEGILDAAEPPVLHDAAERWQQQVNEAAGVAGAAAK